MVKVITYGTYDLLHYGHIRLLKRAKELGDYLIVGVTADDFDKTRGKINVQQTLAERMRALRDTGIADEIIVEEYEGQKIDDIIRYDVDIFTVGSDWKGKFDYLNKYCKVVYLDRTVGVSSSELRNQKRNLKLGLVGESDILLKIIKESRHVNGLQVTASYTEKPEMNTYFQKSELFSCSSYEELLTKVDAVYIISTPNRHYEQIKQAIEHHIHVLCESPLTLNRRQCEELFHLAAERNVILSESIKTAYSTAYHRMMLLAKTGIIGHVTSLDASCTSIKNIDFENRENMTYVWNSIYAWGPTALLPIFQLLGSDYQHKQIVSNIVDEMFQYDTFTKISFVYPDAVASIKVGQGVKTEGELVISGTEGYIYVPAPWWKTEYFELRFEHSEENRRYFYQLDGEGIRYMLVSLVKAVEDKKKALHIDEKVSLAITEIAEDFATKKDIILLG